MRTPLTTLLLAALLFGATTSMPAHAEQPLSYQETRQLGLAKKDIDRWTYALNNEADDAFADPATVEKYTDFLGRAQEHVDWFPNKTHPDVVAFIASASTFEAAVQARLGASGGAQSDADRTLVETIEKKLVQVRGNVNNRSDVEFANKDFLIVHDDLMQQVYYDLMSFEDAEHPRVKELQTEYDGYASATKERKAKRKEAVAAVGGDPAEIVQGLVDKWYAIPFKLVSDPSVERIDEWSETMAGYVFSRESDLAMLKKLESADMDQKTRQRLLGMQQKLEFMFKTKLEENLDSTFRYLDFQGAMAVEAHDWFDDKDPLTSYGQRWFTIPRDYNQRYAFMESAVVLLPAIERADQRLARTDAPDRQAQLAKATTGLEMFATKRQLALESIRMPPHNGDAAGLAAAKKVLAAEVARGAANEPLRISVLSSETGKKSTWERDRDKIMQVNWSWTDIFVITAEKEDDGTFHMHQYRIRKWNSGYAVTLNEWRRSERFDRGPILEENIHK